VERNFSYAIARAFAGHSGKSDAGTTSTYVRADIVEVLPGSFDEDVDVVVGEDVGM
jgi:hypothetical protein